MLLANDRKLNESIKAFPSMYSSTFVFAKKQFDEEFYRLDEAIAAVAKGIPGYLGEEAWESASTGLVSNVYYWQSLESLHVLMDHPIHAKAKAAQSKWLNGYQVVIAQVIRTYGDSKINHLVASAAEV